MSEHRERTLAAFERDASRDGMSCPWCGDDVTRLRGDKPPVPEWRCIKCGMEFRVTAPPESKWSGAHHA